MCGCIGHTVCGYHTQLIGDLLDQLAEAEAAGDDHARSLRGELAAYGVRTEIVRNNLAGRKANR